MDRPLESAALLSAVPVPARATVSTVGVLPWAPLVGVALGGAAAGAAVVGDRWVSPMVGAVLAVAVLGLSTRGLHLDGLADTADGLGPLRGPERALQVMRQGDVGPFGVVTIVLVLLLQIACLAAMPAGDGGWLPLWVAVVTARLAMARTGLPGVPVAEGSSLGRAVAGTVSLRWLAGCALAATGLIALATGGQPMRVAQLAGCAAAGLLAAELLFRRARRRLGGVNGDVTGAMGETATTATLLAAAVLWA